MVNRRLAGLMILGLLFVAACAQTTPESSDNSGEVNSDTAAANVAGSHGESIQVAADNATADERAASQEHTHPEHHAADHADAKHSAVDNHPATHHSKDKAHGQRRNGHGHSAAKTRVRHPDAIDVGDKVPDFEVTIAGHVRKLSELQKDTAITADGTISLTFWCSFCHSCRNVEHALDKLATHHKGKVGVIAVDASFGETAEGIADFAKKEGLSLPIALNSSGHVADIFGVATTTTTVVIDANGVLRYRGQFGNKNHAYAADAIEAVLAGQPVLVNETEHRG